MIGRDSNLCIRVSDKVYNNNKPVFGDLSYVVVKNQMLALKCYGCLYYIFNAIGRKDLADEVRELLFIAFVKSSYSEMKHLFYSNPVNPFSKLDKASKDNNKLHSQFNSLLRSGANRLTMLCGENWYKHISNGIDDINNFKLNCVPSIFNPYNSNGYMNSDIKFETLYAIVIL